MALFESEIGCKKHLTHQQQPGVCSSCLREKLLRLYGGSSSSSSSSFSSSSRTKRNRASTSSCSSSLSSSPAANYYSSASSSTNMSPLHRGHHRIPSALVGSISFEVTENGVLRKSRSMAVVARGGTGEVSGGKKRGGFWSKLLRSTGKSTKKVFMHSRTVKLESFE
ncbi:unnamed protein product [Ilex paraguariensis]|uniref:Uncharacterized protein n=1 Tax=Ilex paraguariensis TaxID=185542 RepID=A0ABC8SG65_9AQUA